MSRTGARLIIKGVMKVNHAILTSTETSFAEASYGMTFPVISLPSTVRFFTPF